MQRATALLPVFTRNLEMMFGTGALGDARRMWGAVTDVISGATGLPPTFETLLSLGFRESDRMGYIILPAEEFSVSGTPTKDAIDFEVGGATDLRRVLSTVEMHDRAVKPKLTRFSDEIRAYDSESAEAIQGKHELATLGDLVRLLPDEPTDFPLWDGRPLFLHEQKSLLDYLIKGAAVEILADNLVDDVLGEHLLRLSGFINNSLDHGGPVLDIEALPPRMRTRPLALVCHSVGKAALGALAVFDPQSDALDRLYVVEMAVQAELGIDVSQALQSTRARIVDHELRIFTGEVIDLTRPMRHAIVKTYEFPELGSH